jgi:hypothetical protein
VGTGRLFRDTRFPLIGSRGSLDRAMHMPLSIRPDAPSGPPHTRLRHSLWLLPALLLLAACGGGTGAGPGACVAPADAPPELVAGGGNDRLTIVNDDAALAGLVTCVDEPVTVEGDPLATAFKATDGARLGGGKHGQPVGQLTLTLVSEVAPPTVVGVPRFTGTGANDLEAGGDFSIDGPVAYVVEIDAEASGEGGTDTFRWSDDGGATWAAEGVAITGASQALSDGVEVTFGAVDGHAAGDLWRFEAARLQAGSVSMHGSHAVVSYDVAGAPHLGAILVFQKFTHDPVLRSGALFRDEDVHAVDVFGDKVYAAGAAEPGSFTDLATLERLSLNGSRLTLDGYGRLGLPGFAANSVIRDGQVVYATSGTGGGLTAVADATFTPLLTVPLDDARWVDVEKKTVAVAEGGALGGTLSLLDGALPALPLDKALPFDGADQPESKTTVQVVGGKAYIAAGRAGVLVVSLATGDVLARVPVPDDSGADPADVVANAVAVDGHLMFISFGGAGVYVAETAKPCSDPDDGQPLDLTVLGRLRFGDFQSTNHVAVLDGHLFVASGLGGLKIVRVDYHR